MLGDVLCVVTPVLMRYKQTGDAAPLSANQLTWPQVEVDYSDFKFAGETLIISFVIFTGHILLKLQDRVWIKIFLIIKDDCIRRMLNLCQYPRRFLICFSQIMNPVDDKLS